MSRPCHPRLCHSSQGHGIEWSSRESLWANCQLSASSGYHAEFHEFVIRRIPISDAGGQCETKHRLSWTRKRMVAAHYKKYDVTQFGYFRLPRGLSRRKQHCRSRAGARHGMCELTHGMAGERHGNGTGAAWERPFLTLQLTCLNGLPYVILFTMALQP